MSETIQVEVEGGVSIVNGILREIILSIVEDRERDEINDNVEETEVVIIQESSETVETHCHTETMTTEEMELESSVICTTNEESLKQDVKISERLEVEVESGVSIVNEIITEIILSIVEDREKKEINDNVEEPEVVIIQESSETVETHCHKETIATVEMELESSVISITNEERIEVELESGTSIVNEILSEIILSIVQDKEREEINDNVEETELELIKESSETVETYCHTETIATEETELESGVICTITEEISVIEVKDDLNNVCEDLEATKVQDEEQDKELTTSTISHVEESETIGVDETIELKITDGVSIIEEVLSEIILGIIEDREKKEVNDNVEETEVVIIQESSETVEIYCHTETIATEEMELESSVISVTNEERKEVELESGTSMVNEILSEIILSIVQDKEREQINDNVEETEVVIIQESSETVETHYHKETIATEEADLESSVICTTHKEQASICDEEWNENQEPLISSILVVNTEINESKIIEAEDNLTKKEICETVRESEHLEQNVVLTADIESHSPKPATDSSENTTKESVDKKHEFYILGKLPKFRSFSFSYKKSILNSEINEDDSKTNEDLKPIESIEKESKHQYKPKFGKAPFSKSFSTPALFDRNKNSQNHPSSKMNAVELDIHQQDRKEDVTQKTLILDNSDRKYDNHEHSDPITVVHISKFTANREQEREGDLNNDNREINENDHSFTETKVLIVKRVTSKETISTDYSNIESEDTKTETGKISEGIVVINESKTVTVIEEGEEEKQKEDKLIVLDELQTEQSNVNSVEIMAENKERDEEEIKDKTINVTLVTVESTDIQSNEIKSHETEIREGEININKSGEEQSEIQIEQGGMDIILISEEDAEVKVKNEMGISSSVDDESQGKNNEKTEQTLIQKENENNEEVTTIEIVAVDQNIMEVNEIKNERHELEQIVTIEEEIKEINASETEQTEIESSEIINIEETHQLVNETVIDKRDQQMTNETKTSEEQMKSTETLERTTEDDTFLNNKQEDSMEIKEEERETEITKVEFQKNEMELTETNEIKESLTETDMMVISTLEENNEQEVTTDIIISNQEDNVTEIDKENEEESSEALKSTEDLMESGVTITKEETNEKETINIETEMDQVVLAESTGTRSETNEMLSVETGEEVKVDQENNNVLIVIVSTDIKEKLDEIEAEEMTEEGNKIDVTRMMVENISKKDHEESEENLEKSNEDVIQDTLQHDHEDQIRVNEENDRQVETINTDSENKMAALDINLALQSEPLLLENQEAVPSEIHGDECRQLEINELDFQHLETTRSLEINKTTDIKSITEEETNIWDSNKDMDHDEITDPKTVMEHAELVLEKEAEPVEQSFDKETKEEIIIKDNWEMSTNLKTVDMETTKEDSKEDIIISLSSIEEVQGQSETKEIEETSRDNLTIIHVQSESSEKILDNQFEMESIHNENILNITESHSQNSLNRQSHDVDEGKMVTMDMSNSTLVVNSILGDIINGVTNVDSTAELQKELQIHEKISVSEEEVHMTKEHRNTENIIEESQSQADIKDSMEKESRSSETDVDLKYEANLVTVSTLKSEPLNEAKVEGRKMSIQEKPNRRESQVSISYKKKMSLSGNVLIPDKTPIIVKSQSPEILENSKEKKSDITKTVKQSNRRMSLDTYNKNTNVIIKRKSIDITAYGKSKRSSISVISEGVSENKTKTETSTRSTSDLKDTNITDETEIMEKSNDEEIKETTGDGIIEKTTDKEIQETTVEIKSQFYDKSETETVTEDNHATSIELIENENAKLENEQRLDVTEMETEHISKQTDLEVRSVETVNKIEDNNETVTDSTRRLSLEQCQVSETENWSEEHSKTIHQYSQEKQISLTKPYKAATVETSQQNEIELTESEEKEENVVITSDNKEVEIEHREELITKEKTSTITVCTSEVEITKERNEMVTQGHLDNKSDENITKDEKEIINVELEHDKETVEIIHVEDNEYENVETQQMIVETEEIHVEKTEINQQVESETSFIHTTTLEAKDETSNKNEVSEVTETKKPWIIESWVDNENIKNEEKENKQEEIMIEKESVEEISITASQHHTKTDDMKLELRRKIQKTNYKADPVETYIYNVEEDNSKIKTKTEERKTEKKSVSHSKEKSEYEDEHKTKDKKFKLRDKVAKNKIQTLEEKETSVTADKKTERKKEKKDRKDKTERFSKTTSDEFEFRRIKSNIEILKIQVQQHKQEKKDFVPYIYNDLQPYGDTTMYENLRIKKPKSATITTSRVTAIDLCDPWKSYEMDKLILPPIGMSSAYVGSKIDTHQRRSHHREKSADNPATSQRNDLFRKQAFQDTTKPSKENGDRRLESPERKPQLSSRKAEEHNQKTQSDSNSLSINKSNSQNSANRKSKTSRPLFVYQQNPSSSKKASHEIANGDREK